MSDAASAARPLRGSPRGRKTTFRAAAPRVLAATNDAVFLAVEREAPPRTADQEDAPEAAALIALDVKELTARWTAPLESSRMLAGARRGEDLLLVEDRDLVLRRGSSGEVLARAELPLRPLALEVAGDRAVVTFSGPKGAAVVGAFEVGEKFGAELWRHQGERAPRPRARVAGERVLVGGWGQRALAALTLDAGVAQPPIELGGDEKLAALEAADAHGALLALHKAEHPVLEERAADGRALWRHDARFTELALARDHVLGVTRDESGRPGEVLLALEREKGTIVWMQELAASPAGVAPAHRLAVSGDVVYCGTAGSKIAVTAYELATGASVFERSFTLPVDLEPLPGAPSAAPAFFGLAALDERVALVVGSEGETVVALLEP